MRKIAFTLFTFLFATSLYSAPVVGWDKAKWGMSPESVKKIYSSDKIENDEGRLIIPHKNINGKIYRIVFAFNSGKLNEISLVLNNVKYLGYTESVNSLSKKYGAPANTSKEKTVWSLPETSIECEYTDMYSGNDIVVITYSSQKESGL